MSNERTFTLGEAQALLPTLQNLLEVAMRCHQQLEEIDDEFHALISRILLSGGIQIDPLRTAQRRVERDRHAKRLEDAVEEITHSGVQLKDLDTGLLDFPCVVRGDVVLLCWKLGESTIAHWHGTQEGFANRKPLDASMFPHDHSQRVH